MSHIRWMIRRDMPEVMDIEEQSFEFPWPEEEFIYYLHQRNCIGVVAEYEDEFVGFMIYRLYRNRIHLLNFAIHPEWRRLGIGSQIIETLLNLEILKQYFYRDSSHLKYLVSEVRETNLPAQLFFRDRGFKAIKVLRKYYEDTPEDAYVMQYRYKSPQNEIEKPENLLARIIGRILD